MIKWNLYDFWRKKGWKLTPAQKTSRHTHEVQEPEAEKDFSELWEKLLTLLDDRDRVTLSRLMDHKPCKRTDVDALKAKIKEACEE
jgi:hypothetical protein